MNKFFLLDGLDPGGEYSIEWLMLDRSGYGSVGGSPYLFLTTPELDEAAPVVLQNTVVQKTDTTVKIHFESDEHLSKLKVRYRIIGTAIQTDSKILRL